jgi:hypothetical protein
MRVEKLEFEWEFSQLSCPGQSTTRVAWELMRVEKGEFAWEFSQLSWPGQMRTRVARELRSNSLYQSFLNSRVPVNRQQELHETWWELRSESLHESFLNSYVPIEREQELHESWWELRSESLHESFLNSHAQVKWEQELHESWWELRSKSLYQSFLNSRVPVNRQQELHESWWELRRESLHESFLNSRVSRSIDNKSCMRVEKGEFAWEFSQLLYCRGQSTTTVAWELTIESLHESWLDVATRSKNPYIWTIVKIWTSLKFMRDESQTRPRPTTLINSHQLSS